MTWTRTERAALDYVIAGLAVTGYVNLSTAGDLPTWPRHVLDWYNQTWLDGADLRELRMMAARLALYLRLLRRVEAWERGEEWARVWFTDDVGGDVARDQDWRWLCQRGRRLGPECQPRMTPWHPLWLDAPTHDPTITPRMRREAREARRAAIHAVAKATFGTLAKAMPEVKR